MPKAVAFKQTSTVISDAGLAGCCYFAAYTAYLTQNLAGALGFLSIGIAASAGVLRIVLTLRASRFNGIQKAIWYHDFFTFFASSGSLLYLAAAFWFPPKSSSSPDVIVLSIGVVVAFALFVFGSQQRKSLKEVIPLVVGFVFMGTAAYRSYINQVWIGIAGVVLFAVVGLAGTSGSLQGIKKVDVFHYGLALSLLLLSQALVLIH